MLTVAGKNMLLLYLKMANVISEIATKDIQKFANISGTIGDVNLLWVVNTNMKATKNFLKPLKTE